MGSILLTNFSTAKLVRDSFPITKEESRASFCRVKEFSYVA